jgi:putative transposase
MGCKIAPATYYEHRSRTPTKQELRDEALKPKITAAHAANYGVFGARKIWLTLNRERPVGAAPIARCTVERLMAELGLTGALRGKVKHTTISDPKQPKPHDLVNRNFRPLARTGFGSPTSPNGRAEVPRGNCGVGWQGPLRFHRPRPGAGCRVSR